MKAIPECVQPYCCHNGCLTDRSPTGQWDVAYLERVSVEMLLHLLQKLDAVVLLVSETPGLVMAWTDQPVAQQMLQRVQALPVAAAAAGQMVWN